MGKINGLMAKIRGKNRIVLFLIIIGVCIIAISLGIYSQFFYKYSETDPLMLGIHIGEAKTSEEYAELKANFSSLFTNELHVNSESIKVDKIETSQSVVFSQYTLDYPDETYYSVQLELPILNIDNEVAKEINAQIKEEFYDTAYTIMRQTSGYTVYNVSYVAYVNSNIISIVINETAKYGTSSETTVIRTYNYDMSTNTQVSLTDLIELKETTVSEVQKSIDSTVQTAYENSLSIAEEYGTEVIRDPEDEMYEVENAETYFLTDDGYVYIVYAYGETLETNEMDIVIF